MPLKSQSIMPIELNILNLLNLHINILLKLEIIIKGEALFQYVFRASISFSFFFRRIKTSLLISFSPQCYTTILKILINHKDENNVTQLPKFDGIPLYKVLFMIN